MSDVHSGSCHCGAVTVAFSAPLPLDEMRFGRCDCSFCRRHGARTMSHPKGQLTIRTAKGGLARYRFGLKVTDFLLCATCGVYVAALISSEGRDYATFNVNLLDARDSLDPAPPLFSYDGETAEARTARRLGRWTPTRVEERDD